MSLKHMQAYAFAQKSLKFLKDPGTDCICTSLKAVMPH